MPNALKKKSARLRQGDVLSILLLDGRFTFARVLESPIFAFYELKSARIPNISEIVRKPILFKLIVFADTENWVVVGHAPLEPELQEYPYFFRYSFRPHAKEWEFFIRQQDLSGLPASPEACVGLENDTGWSGEIIEERLNEHYAGRTHPDFEKHSFEAYLRWHLANKAKS